MVRPEPLSSAGVGGSSLVEGATTGEDVSVLAAAVVVVVVVLAVFVLAVSVVIDAVFVVVDCPVLVGTELF